MNHPKILLALGVTFLAVDALVRSSADDNVEASPNSDRLLTVR